MKNQGSSLRAGDAHYRAYVGPPGRYDFMSSSQFRLLATLGLRGKHKVLDYGCGSLRLGRLLIPFLNSGNYFGQDPNQWLIDDGLDLELGRQIIELKNPSFSNRSDFEVDFPVKFDFIVAQSIFSHTNLELATRGLASIRQSLAPEGLALFTLVEGGDYQGDESWVYPGCTTFRPQTIRKMFREVGLSTRRLSWFHPGQTWFVGSKSKDFLPSIPATLFILGGEEIGHKAQANVGFLTSRWLSVQRFWHAHQYRKRFKVKKNR